jgi:hypothetical protein
VIHGKALSWKDKFAGMPEFSVIKSMWKAAFIGGDSASRWNLAQRWNFPASNPTTEPQLSTVSEPLAETASDWRKPLDACKLKAAAAQRTLDASHDPSQRGFNPCSSQAEPQAS